MAEFTRKELLPMAQRSEGKLQSKACEALIKGIFKMLCGANEVGSLAMPCDCIYELFLEGMSSKEIAVKFNIPEPAVSKFIDEYDTMKETIYNII